MSFAPYAVLWVALVAVSVLLIPAARRPRPGLILSFGLPVAALLAGLFLRPDAVAPAWGFAGRQWAITGTAYGLTGAALLLLLVAVGQHYLQTRAGKHETRQLPLLFALTAASLPALWAADGRTRVLGLALFTAVWVVSIYLLQIDQGVAPFRWATPATRAAWAVFCLWVAAALPAWRVPLSLFASAVLLGIWPLATRSARAEAIDLLGEGMIVVLGAAIAASALQSDVPSGVLVAVATAVGLMSMVAGLFHAWQSAPRQMASAIRPALGGLALTAAVWIGPTALVPAARLVVFAPAMLIVAAQLGARELDASVDGLVARRSSPKMVAVLIVLLALTGLPLTVGFDVLSPLYGAWLGAGGWALLLLTALLLSFWVVAMVQSGRAAMRGEAAGRTAWLRSAALLPPLLGLISLRLPATDVMPLICVALAAPLVTGLVLARFMPGLDSVGDLLREAVALPEPVHRLAAYVRRAGQTALDALTDALAILEGEYGLLWLLGILLLLLWVA